MFKWPIFFLVLFLKLFTNDHNLIKDKGQLCSVKIIFDNVVNDSPMVLHDKIYTNNFGETYSINKFKYYIGNVSFKLHTVDSGDDYHLINQGDSNSLDFTVQVEAGVYDSLFFLLGVDSLYNVSGAQTGALDPVNDMFWTWNSGYVMAKMEGQSSSSTFNNIYEFHIGGFSGRYNVLKKIALPLSPMKLNLVQGKTAQVIVKADAAKWWQGSHDIRISTVSNITSPGEMAKKISDNYSKMFTITSVSNN